MGKPRRRRHERRLRRARKYVAAFSLQVYLSVAFAYMAVVVWIGPTGLTPEGFWPLIFLAGSIACLLSVLRPFSATVAAATGSLIATVAAARMAAIVGTPPLSWPSSIQLIGLSLWGLLVVVGLRWPRVAYDSGVKHLLDVAREGEPDDPDLRNGT